MQNELPAVDDPKLECIKDTQDPFNSQDPYAEASKLLAAAGDGESERNDSMDGGPKEDSDVIRPLQSRANDMSQSPHITHTLAATALQESVGAMNGQSASSSSIISASDDRGRPQEVVEVANDKQEWEICGIIGKEDVDGVRGLRSKTQFGY
jgi:hypothetical protein